LLFVSALLADSNLSITFLKTHFFIQEVPHSKKIGSSDLTEGLYVLSSSACFDDNPTTRNSVSYNSCTNSVFSCQNVVPRKNASVWHSRFGYVSDKILRLLSNEIPFDMSHSFSTSDCQISPLAKFRRLSFTSLNNVSHSLFDILHCDIWGPYGKPTYDGKRFFLTLVDDCSRFTWIFLLTHKSEAASAIKQFFQKVKTQFGATIKCLRSDNAKELALTEFQQNKKLFVNFLVWIDLNKIQWWKENINIY